MEVLREVKERWQDELLAVADSMGELCALLSDGITMAKRAGAPRRLVRPFRDELSTLSELRDTLQRVSAALND